ncbi:MAG: TonB-dependent receptor [Sphingomonadaceae bacterium]
MTYHTNNRSPRYARYALYSALSLVLAAPAAAWANEDNGVAADSAQEAGAASRSRSQDDFHDRRRDDFGEILVSAVGVKELDVLAGVSIMEGQELQRNMAGQIGEVLTSLPGVTASGFVPGASRPILRGMSGERVKVLVNGIGAIDASNTSADHAVTIDPLTAERIEVLRGPAVMLYGSQAIGGAVNVIDKRIPLRMPDEAVHIDAMANFDTVADLREGGVSVDVPAGQYFVLHVDGNYRKTDDVSVPGYILSEPMRQDFLADAALEDDPDEAEELREAANRRGKLGNSATETWSVNAGAALFAGNSTIGVSFGVYDTTYGVPEGVHEHEHDDHDDDDHDDHAEEGVTIGMRQYRADMRGEIDLGDGFFKTLHTRAGFSDYTHTEYEGGEVGTVFDVQGIEARAELEQAEHGSWKGSIGTQYYFRDFSALGDEAYIAPNRTDQYSVFALQEFAAGPILFEIAGRYEATDVRSRQVGLDRHFDSFSGAVGIAHETSGGLRFGVNGSRATRAPAAEELLADGAHIATQAYEVGDPDLGLEKAWGVEAYMRGTIGPVMVNIAAYRNWFSNYIYLDATGAEEDGLPVYNYIQRKVDYVGIEGEISAPLIKQDGFGLNLDLRGDYVRAELTDGTPLPRIPPLSLAGALEAQTDALDGRVELQWFDNQKRVGAFETPTDSFLYTNASLAWRPLSGNRNLSVIVACNNIFDVEGRRHSSFTKDFVPLPGRNFRLSVRLSM